MISEPQAPTGKPMDAESRRLGRKLAGLFLGIVVVLGLSAFFYLAQQQRSARESAHAEVSAIADLKLRQISNWREERLSDAHFFAQARFVAEDVRRFLDAPDSEAARAGVLHWLSLLKSGDRYNGVGLFDARGERRLALPASAGEPAAYLRKLLAKARESHDVVVTDLHRDEANGFVHLDILFPIYEGAAPQQGRPMAFVLLKLDARQFLFPLVRSWPTPSRTAETLLVRREDDSVVYLNDVRHRTGTALTLRLPLTSPELPAAQVLRGQTNVVEGVDYRGVPVVAAGRLIPGTAWGMVAKIDRKEIYAPVRQQMLAAMCVLGALLMASALLVALLWRQHRAQFLERELALEKDRASLAERVAHLMRHANDIILLLTREGRIVEANECALKAYGYNLQEIQQKKVHDLRPPEAVARAEQDLQRVEREGSLLLETVHRRKDGGSFPVEVSARKVDVGGEDFILSIIRDISQRKAYEREIERLNRLYAALSQVNQAVVRAGSREALLHEVCRVLVQDGGFQMAWIGWMDGAGAQVTPVAQFGDEAGYLREVRVFTDLRPEGQGPMGRAIREGRPCVCNDMQGDPNCAPWYAAGARSGWRSLAAFPVRQAGHICGALAVYARQRDFFGPKEQSLVEEAAADISFGLDILLNEERRKEAEDRLRLQAAALQAAANSIVITGRDGVIQWVNPAFEGLTGYSAGEAVGQTPHILNSGRHGNAFFRQMWKSITAGRVWHGELINRRKDGTLYTEEMTITPVKDRQGTITHFVAIKQDVTARKQAEEEARQAREDLARANADLEGRVQERTAQLRESVAELEAFSYSMSHDLRSPLRAIRAFTSITLDEYRDRLGEGGVGMLQKVESAAGRMDQLVTDVLALSSVSRAQITIERVDTDRLVRQIIQERPELQPPRAEVSIEGKLAAVMGHEASLTQCLTNLLSNAVKFVAPGVPPRVRVWAERRGEQVRLWVEDNGIGIPPEAHEKIFGIFQRLHSQRAYEGTGIGLAIVKRAVERMGGHVGVDSEPGKGSRFWVELHGEEPA